MRTVPFAVSPVVTVALVFALNKRWGAVPELGNFLSPQTGFWQNAEAGGENRDEEFAFKNVKGKVSVYLDERLVPHVYAENDKCNNSHSNHLRNKDNRIKILYNRKQSG